MFCIPCDIFNNNNEDEHDNEEKECFICFEKNDDILFLREIEKNGYIKNCDCNGIIHIHCISKWYQINKKCPICRQRMDKKNIPNHTRSMIILNLSGYLIFYCNIVWFFIGLYFFIYYLTKANELIIQYITNFSSSKMIPKSCN
jgi:hypothetical protein